MFHMWGWNNPYACPTLASLGRLNHWACALQVGLTPDLACKANPAAKAVASVAAAEESALTADPCIVLAKKILAAGSRDSA